MGDMSHRPADEDEDCDCDRRHWPTRTGPAWALAATRLIEGLVAVAIIALLAQCASGGGIW